MKIVFDNIMKGAKKSSLPDQSTKQKEIILDKKVADVQDRKEFYKDIYRPDGTLIHPVQGGVLALGSLNPIDLDRNGTSSLVAHQRIIGTVNMDTLGYVEIIFRTYYSESPFIQIDEKSELFQLANESLSFPTTSWQPQSFSWLNTALETIVSLV